MLHAAGWVATCVDRWLLASLCLRCEASPGLSNGYLRIVSLQLVSGGRAGLHAICRFILAVLPAAAAVTHSFMWHACNPLMILVGSTGALCHDLAWTFS